MNWINFVEFCFERVVSTSLSLLLHTVKYLYCSMRYMEI